ncbi:MAG: LysR family transcriptional regulator [Alphaproteobacteria bacterium]|nr:LysR family transcriptional regulator [Alphaproteobacteria bacterium]
MNSLRVFEAVARHMSFSRAAAELNLTPSALSHQIRTLEDHFDQPLFKRMNRSIALTQAGRRLLPGDRAGLLLLNEAVAELAAPAERHPACRIDRSGLRRQMALDAAPAPLRGCPSHL